MEDKYTITCDTDQSFSKTIGTNVPEKTADPTPEPVAENSLATSAAPEASPQTLHDGNAWAVSGNYFFRSYKVIDHIPSAVYNIGQNNQIGTYLEKSPVIKDGLIELADTATTDIIREFDKFWNLKDNFVKRGFVHKRGFLLWGPPGSGKTTCLNLLAERIVKERGGIVINGGRPDYLNAGLKLVRDIEVNRPVIVTIEDFDDLVRPAGAETAYLQILDGEAQINNVVFIATTNYPERLDRRFVDRPSRFDTIKYIGMPNAKARAQYLRYKEPDMPDDEVDYWVDLSNGFSVAHLKEMIISCKCLGNPIEDVVKRLADLHKRQPTSDDAETAEQSVGFLGSRR